MDERRSALIVSAHSADFVWRCGGAIALHRSIGWKVTVICLSFGERGESAKLWKQAGMTLDKVKAARRVEAERATNALSVNDIRFFDLGDYPLEFNRETKHRLVDAMREIRPEFILTHSKYDPYNTDYMHTSSFVLEARMIAQAWGMKTVESFHTH